MIRAAREVRSYGNHIKHLFSCGEYWMHKDIMADIFEEYIRPMAVLPRGPATRQQLEKQFPRLGRYLQKSIWSHLNWRSSSGNELMARSQSVHIDYC